MNSVLIYREIGFLCTIHHFFCNHNRNGKFSPRPPDSQMHYFARFAIPGQSDQFQWTGRHADWSAHSKQVPSHSPRYQA